MHFILIIGMGELRSDQTQIRVISLKYTAKITSDDKKR